MRLCNKCKTQIKNAMLRGEFAYKEHVALLDVFRSEIIKAYKNGQSLSEIAKEYGTTKATMFRYLKEQKG